ncbi:MAG: hypothetical protein C7B45_09815 [Sulfobacillus acidophilus]|uniref:Fumarylacetoacetase-like C-terminal domain-containing protein n=1 Tax=Sulfobacillus acidophilus TaxID=53633 RepID=A0A2T2WHH3_9FIRM|nr:MAG: hypothetical protein C7B45_09815 [Sulfobacillus acidophilus]
MRFANIRVEGRNYVAVSSGGEIRRLPAEIRGKSVTAIEHLLEMDASEVNALVDDVLRSGVTVPSDAFCFRSVVERPHKILCVGLNYRRHAEETHTPIPTLPVIFGKFAQTLAACDDEIPLPRRTQCVDYEVELAMVVGRTCHDVDPEHARDYVFGYTVANDISARDLQNATSQWLIGKSLDRFCPTGPFVVTSDEISNPDDLSIQLRRNGILCQNSRTSDMIFSCGQIVAYLSSLWTLEPGDLILTGTPEGVILGQPESERRWIADGDCTEATIEGIGTLRNVFVRSLTPGGI